MSASFKQFAQTADLTSKYNSIRDRICSIDSSYFERLHQAIFKIYNKELQQEHSLSKSDSTYVSIAAKLISIGMLSGRKSDGKKQIKYSINLKGSLPSSVKVFTEQSFISEDNALSALIEQTDCITEHIVVFDRGLQLRKSYDKFTHDHKLFVTRAHPNAKVKIVEERVITPLPADSSITIKSDVVGYLYDAKSNPTTCMYRIIRGIIHSSGEEIVFVSNLLDKEAYFIAQLYKQRWEIDVFFKYIKQHLNVSHLVSRQENGIKVMIYMTMILASLIIVYKKKNNIKGFKIAKLKFSIELENEIIQSIVLLWGANPKNAPPTYLGMDKVSNTCGLTPARFSFSNNSK